MTVPFLDLTEQYRTIEDEITEAIRRVVESQSFILGPEVAELEQEVTEYVGARYAVGVASGTDALLLPLKALDAEPGSEVIVPSFTFFATAGAVWNAGLKPVFCDVDPETFNVTAESLERVWTDKTVAIVPVHLFGQMAPMKEVMALAKARGVFVIEDGAQAFGASSPLGSAGAVGDVGTYSFFPTKNLGGFGDGGMIVTDDEGLAEALGKTRVHGGRKMYHHETVGTNSRLDAIQAAVLRVKLRYLDMWAEKRRRNASYYTDTLSGIDGLTTPKSLEGFTHVYNQYTMKVDRRDELKEHLKSSGIGSGIYYPVPLHLQQCFRQLGGEKGDCPVTEELCQKVLSLPIYPELGEGRRGLVTQEIKRFYG
jgi:dTDP-4-amino-4,6-dideoxygalactose transaminase